MLHFVGFELGLHCLPMSPKWSSGIKRVNKLGSWLNIFGDKTGIISSKMIPKVFQDGSRQVLSCLRSRSKTYIGIAFLAAASAALVA